MELKAYSIRDQKTGIFHCPFFKTTEPEALRDFAMLVNDGKSRVHSFPEDFDLYFLGTYDDNEGKFQALDTPNHLMKAVNCIRVQVPENEA